MTVKRIYICNLCNNELKGLSGIGLAWKSPTDIIEKHFQDTEKHLCHDCVIGLTKLLKHIENIKNDDI